jgi:hypothetical protein
VDGSEIIRILSEEIHSGNTINWDYWASLCNITPAQAAKLAYQIDPINWPDTRYYEQGALSDVLREKIARLESWLEGHSSVWSLVDLVPALGESLAPSDMANAVRNIAPVDPKVEVVCDYVSFMQMEFMQDLVSKGLNKHLSHFTIAELWSIANGQRIRSNVWLYQEKISQAIVDGDLVAEVSIPNSKVLGGYEVIPTSPTLLSQVKDGWVMDGENDENDTWLQYTIHRDNFRAWLVKSNQWPLADDCLLAKWFESEPQDKAEGNDGKLDNNKTTTKRTTKLNDWLRARWDEWGKPNARDFAAKLKPFAGSFGSPVKKYHGWYPDVVVDWKPDWGSTKGSWGSRAFQNKVNDFKRKDKEAAKK